jgi:hypothetical protein
LADEGFAPESDDAKLAADVGNSGRWLAVVSDDVVAVLALRVRDPVFELVLVRLSDPADRTAIAPVASDHQALRRFLQREHAHARCRAFHLLYGAESESAIEEQLGPRQGISGIGLHVLDGSPVAKGERD